VTAGKIFRHLKENLEVFEQQIKKKKSGSVKVLAIEHLSHSDAYDV